jgi:hypothetical protein
VKQKAFLFIIKTIKENEQIFKNWFHKMFVPEVQYFLREDALPQEVVVLLDNAPSHLSAVSPDDGLITVKLLSSHNASEV